MQVTCINSYFFTIINNYTFLKVDDVIYGLVDPDQLLLVGLKA